MPALLPWWRGAVHLQTHLQVWVLLCACAMCLFAHAWPGQDQSETHKVRSPHGHVIRLSCTLASYKYCRKVLSKCGSVAREVAEAWLLPLTTLCSCLTVCAKAMPLVSLPLPVNHHRAGLQGGDSPDPTRGHLHRSRTPPSSPLLGRPLRAHPSQPGRQEMKTG